MNKGLRSDLHIHTVLSACASLDMSPSNIVREAVRKGLDVIAVTDHNAAGNCRVTYELGKENDLIVLSGIEVTVEEEFHAVTLFDKPEKAEMLAGEVKKVLLPVDIDEERMGYQLIVDRDENIISAEKIVLNQATIPFDDLKNKVEELDGFLFFSHIDKSYASIVANLGFIPPRYMDCTFEIVRENTFGVEKVLKNSVAHFLEDIGHRFSYIKAEKNMNSVFSALKKGEFYYDA